MVTEECKTLYNKLNTFVTKVINRDVQPQIDDLESDVNSLNNSITNLTVKDTYEMTPSNVSNAEKINFTLLGDNIVRLIWVDGSVTCSSSNIGTTKTLGTLPKKYRPPNEQWFTQTYHLDLDKGMKTSLNIRPDGKVNLVLWWTGSNQTIPCVFTDIYPLF